MDNKKIMREQMSAFSDGELGGSQLEAAFSASQEPDGRDAWKAYHQIGDLLRSDELELTFSAGFEARMSARLDAEPTILAPANVLAKPVGAASATSGGATIKRFAIPGAAALAMAVAAIVATPQLMVAWGDADAVTVPSQSLASAENVVSHGAIMPVSAPQVSAVAPAAMGQEVVLRDPHIDEYLMAHQRFSPSVYSTAQYARSATFPTDSDK